MTTIGTLGIRDVAPFLKSLGGTPDKSHRFICVTRSVLLIACTCASLILSGPGAPFLALRSTLVASDSVTISNRSSFSGYAIAGVLLSSSEGGSDKVFQNGITLSRGRLLDSSPHVPRMTSLAVSDWRSRQSPWSLAYLSRFACLLLIFLPSSFLIWAAFCPFRLFILWSSPHSHAWFCSPYPFLFSYRQPTGSRSGTFSCWATVRTCPSLLPNDSPDHWGLRAFGRRWLCHPRQWGARAPGLPQTTPLEIPWHFPDNSLTFLQFSLNFPWHNPSVF